MGLRITEDVLYYAENNEWKPLPAIKGEKGDDGQDGQNGQDGANAYYAWLEKEHLEDTTENYRRWIQEIGRAAAIGASRVVVEDVGGVPTKVAYTPKKLNPSDTQEPPAEGTQFVTYDGTTASCDRIVLGGDSTASSEVRYKGLTTANNNYINPLLFATTVAPPDGGLISEIGYIPNPSNISDVGYNPASFTFAMGNRSTSATNSARTGGNKSINFIMDSFIGTAASNQNTAYRTRRENCVLQINGTNGSLHIGGTNDSNCNLGITTINAGAGSFMGYTVEMNATNTTSPAPNAVRIQRKPYGKTSSTSWSLFNNVDSGHVEHIRVAVKLPGEATFKKTWMYTPKYPSGQTYLTADQAETLSTTWDKHTDTSVAASTRRNAHLINIATRNSYNKMPYIQYSIVNEDMLYYSPFSDHFSISNVFVKNNQLHFTLSCKKDLSSNGSNYLPAGSGSNSGPLYIDFMLFTSDYK